MSQSARVCDEDGVFYLMGPMTKLNILFLGAGKRLSLFERIVSAGQREGVELRLFSYETSPFVPVAKTATIVVGLQWDAPGFKGDVLSNVKKFGIHVLIPCMDGATVALSQIASDVQELGCWPMVSGAELCVAFENKRLAEKWFVEHGVRTPIPESNSPFPWIIKPVAGFASRGQFKVNNFEEYQYHKSRIVLEDYIVQPFLEGPEFTIDAYVSRSGEVLGCVTRRRLQVVDGEVVRSITERKQVLIDEVIRILNIKGWQGPITLQVIEYESDFWFIDVNPRFGGGVILSMEAGADYAQLFVREALGLPIYPVKWREGILMTRAYRETFFKDV